MPDINTKPFGAMRYLRLLIVLMLCVGYQHCYAQLTMSGGYTPAQMAAKLAGPGVLVFGATMNCPANAHGQFRTVAGFGLDSGIVLTSGQAISTSIETGVDIIDGFTASTGSNFANADNATTGDADLNRLSGLTTYDACVLEFDFKPAGDTVRFKYVFGSEEYTSFTCTDYNDVFGFLIRGGAYSVPTNIALVPGTSIPVVINSVNCGPTGSGTLATCTAMGTGSPFCAYYVDNTDGTVVTYDGTTTVMTAMALVSPCDTYHMKLGVADASDHALDSGVFLEAGSLTSRSPVAISGVGLSGIPYCVRGCAPGTFVFSTPVAQDTPIVVRYNITGTAVNGYDYATIADTSVILPFTTSTVVTINPLLVAAAGPKTVILEIQVEDPCRRGTFVTGATATLTILDSFSYRILTPDTSICQGDIVPARAVGDPLFSSILTYNWTPAGTVSNDTSLTPILTPTNTTIYTLTCTAIAAVGCPVTAKTLTVTIYHPSFDSVTVRDASVCGFSDGSITLHGLQTGFMDTVYYTKNGVPQPYIATSPTSAGTITINGLDSGVYSNIYVKVGLCPTVVRGPVTVDDPPPPVVTVDSNYVKTCIGNPVALHSFVSPSGITVSYNWSPPSYLSSNTISNPVVNPLVAGDITYTVTINPSTLARCARYDTVRVHTLAPFVLNNEDTIICIGSSVQARVTGSNEYSYVWFPATGVSSTTVKNPLIVPPVSNNYIVTASYANCTDQTAFFYIQVDTPARVLNLIDTICLGMSTTFDVRVPGTGTGSGYYHYQWTPPADISNDTIPNPVITPVALGTNVYNVNVSPQAASCDVNHTITVEVLPNRVTIRPNDTAICLGNYVQVVGTGHPSFSYQWIPTAGIGISDVLNAMIIPDTSDTYVITASFHRCPDMHDTLRLDVQPNPRVYIGGNRFLCQFDTLHVNSNVTPSWYTGYIYSWTPSADLDFNNTPNVVFSGNTTTELILDVTTPAGCKSNDSAVVTLIPGNFADLAIAEATFCPHDTLQLSPTSTVPGVQYHWYPSMYISDSMSANAVVSPITSQLYTLVVTTPNGCRDTLNFNAIVFAAGVISMEDSTRIFPGESYHIQPFTNCVSLTWFPPAGLNATNVIDPTAIPEVSTRYIATGYTEHNCKVTDSIDVFVNPDAVIDMPNAFTPGTGVNNEFKIIKRGVATLNYFRIFNRWGNLIFETRDIDKGWDGTYKGEPQPFGVYVYEVQAVNSNGRIFVKKGNVTIIR